MRTYTPGKEVRSRSSTSSTHCALRTCHTTPRLRDQMGKTPSYYNIPGIYHTYWNCIYTKSWRWFRLHTAHRQITI